VDDPREIRAGLDAFFALHAERANLHTTVDHPDVFAQPRSREFLTEVCQRLATRGVARIFQLWVDDALVATRIGFVMNDTLFIGVYPGLTADMTDYMLETLDNFFANKSVLTQIAV